MPKLTFKKIHGHFGPVQLKLYQWVISNAPDGFHMLELGAFKGKSTVFAAHMIQSRQKSITFTTVDHFQGNVENRKAERGLPEHLYDMFHENVRQAGVEDVIRVMAMDSLKAATLIPDESQDFIFIDASHDYGSVRRDITAWLPKLKPGGLIAGDDCVPGWPGVHKAVSELVNPHFHRGRVWSNQELPTWP